MKVILFDIDTLRADHMGCYGYGRNTTPVMDQIAKEGVCFERYYCPNAPCLPSRASMAMARSRRPGAEKRPSRWLVPMSTSSSAV